MAFDAPYDHLLRLLSNRAIAWFRDRIRGLPPRLPPEDATTPGLVLAARMAPVLSGWRGAPSPLETIAAEGFDPARATRITALVWRGDMDPDRLAPLMAAVPMADGQPLWQLARQHLALHPPGDLAARLDLSEAPDPRLVAETEAFLCQPAPASPGPHIDLFYRVLTQLYQFGKARPRTIAPRVFGRAFDNCLHFTQWALDNKNLTSLLQMIVCLRLIDPDHDVSELLSEVIPYQRPDGSFPQRCGWSDQPQDLSEAAMPTIIAALAFHMIAYQRWQGPHDQDSVMPPMRSCRNQIAARIMDRLDRAAALPVAQRLLAASSISRATGRNGFLLLSGLRGYMPARDEAGALAAHLAGFPIAARHARHTLALSRPLQDAINALPVTDGPLPDAMRCLKTPATRIDSPCPDHFARDWQEAASQRDEPLFLRHCQQAAQYGLPAAPTPQIRNMAVHLAQREQRAFLARPRAALPELLRRLDLMALLALVFEPEPELAAAA